VSAKQRRRFWLVVGVIAFVPGGVMSLVFRDAVWWVNAQSWAALWLAAFGCYSAETPVEEEGQ